MKQILLLLNILAVARCFGQGGQIVNTNVLLVTGAGATPDNGIYIYTANDVVPGITGYSNSVCSALFLWTGTGGWEFESNGNPGTAVDYYNLSLDPTHAYTVNGAASPAPTVSYYALNTYTNWTSITSNFWTLAGDNVFFSAGGYDLDWPPVTNQLQIFIDATNLVFSGPWISGGRTQWTVQGKVMWDGSNYWSSGTFTCGDTNTPFATDSEVISNVIMGTNNWSFIVVGDTNGLTFSTHTLTAQRIPTNDTPIHAQ